MTTPPALDPLAHRRQQRRVWRDPGRLDPDWDRPRGRGRVPQWLIIGAALLLVVALLVTVGVLGGFADRRDEITRVPAGTVIESGDYRLTWSYATATPDKDFDKAIWRFRAYGTIQTVGDVTADPGVSSYAFVGAQCPANREGVEVSDIQIGTRVGKSYDSGKVTPGLAPVPAVWRFDFSTKCTPTEVLRLIVLDQRYYDNTITKTGEKGWHTLGTGHEILLPVTVMPSAPS